MAEMKELQRMNSECIKEIKSLTIEASSLKKKEFDSNSKENERISYQTKVIALENANEALKREFSNVKMHSEIISEERHELEGQFSRMEMQLNELEQENLRLRNILLVSSF